MFTVAWSPGGQVIASGSRDGAIRLWNPYTATCHLSIADEEEQYRQERKQANLAPTDQALHRILALAWSPDGRLLAAGDTAGVVRIWTREAAGTIEARISLDQTSPLLTYRGHTRFVRSVAWSLDGRYLATGGDFGDSTVQVWDATTGQLITLYTEQYRIFAASWSPQGETIASASFDGTVHLWKALNGEKLLTYRGHHGPVYALAWSPQGLYLASAGQDATVQIWSTSDGSLLQTYRGHTQAIKALGWSPDGQAIASGSDDTTAQIWSPFTSKPVTTLNKHPAWIRAVACSPDGTMLAVASDSAVYLWDL